VRREPFHSVRLKERAAMIRSRLTAGFPSSYVRDLRPLTAIPLLAEDTPSLHPGLNQGCPPLGSIRCPTVESVPVGYPFSVLYGALSGNPPLRPARQCAARPSERTEQGGPPNGDRKCGTGGGPVLYKRRDVTRRRIPKDDWKTDAEHVRWTQPGSRAVGCERGAPLRRSVDSCGRAAGAPPQGSPAIAVTG